MTLYIGVDFHPHQQTVCWLDQLTGAINTRTFQHNTEELTEFYRIQPPSTVGIEATTKADWFAKLLFDNNHQLLIGNSRVIRKTALLRNKNDPNDAAHIFDLLRGGNFPTLWQRPAQSISILELLKLRHNLVRQRTQTANRLQAMAHSAGLEKGKISTVYFQTLLTALELDPPQALQRRALFALWYQLDAQIDEFEKVLEKIAAADEQVQLLRTQKGVGCLTALSLVHTLGDISRFDRATKQVIAFVGLDPVEKSSAGRTRFGSISKAGSKLLRFLLVQAAQTAARYDPQLKGKYSSLKKKKHSAVAKVAIARRLLVKLVVMLRDNISAQEFDRRGRTAGNARGAQVQKR